MAKFGLPTLTIAQAIGLSMVVSFLTMDTRDLKEKENDTTNKIVAMITMAIARPAFTVAIAWIVYQFV